MIAEYERAKIAERYRRGKLFRSRAGEVLAWRTPYGYRRQPRDAHGPARLVVFEPEAAIVRRIFDDAVLGGHSLREIIRRLAADQIPPPTGRGRLWRPSTLSNLLRNEAYIGRIYANRTEAVPDPRPGKRSRQVPRPREDWIAIAVPAIVDDQTFEAAGRVSRDNSQWSPRRAEPGQWLLRGLVKCGICRVGVNCHKRRGRNGTWNRYYHCRNHDPIKAGGDDRRCPERNIRSDALDDVRVRPGPRRPAAPRRAHRRRTGARRAHPHPRRRTARRRAGPPGPQARRHRRRTPPPHRPLPGRASRATRAATPRHRGRAPPPRPGPTPRRPHRATPGADPRQPAAPSRASTSPAGSWP